MAFDAGSVVAHITADIGDFKEKITEAKSIATGFSKTLSSVADGFATVANQSRILAGVVGGGLLLAAKSSIDAFNDADGIMKQTEAVLTSTHHAAGLTEDAILDLATAMQKASTFSDDEVQSAENMLLTFTSIGKDVFPAATQTVLDMSQALGQDLKSSSIQLGKALNDPIQGVNALRRVGVSFTEKQLEQIKVMQESGNLMGAQKLILKELATEFGGSASKATETFAGKMKQLNNDINNLQEYVGETITMALGPLLDMFHKFVSSDGLEQTLYRIEGGLKAIYDLLIKGDFTVLFANIFHVQEDSPIVTFLLQVHDALAAVGAWITAHGPLMLTFIEGLGVGLGALTILGTITLLLGALMNPLVLVAGGIALLYTAWSTNFLGIKDITTQVINFLIFLFNSFKVFWQANGNDIINIVTSTWNVIKGVIEVALGLIGIIIGGFFAAVQGNWGQAWQNVKAGAALLFDGLKNIFGGGINLLKALGGAIFDALTAPFRNALNAIIDIVNAIKDRLDFTKRHSPSVLDVVKGGVAKVNSALEGLNLDMAVAVSRPQVASTQTSTGMGGGITINQNNNVTSQVDMNGAIRDIGFQLRTV